MPSTMIYFASKPQQKLTSENQKKNMAKTACKKNCKSGTK
jgi:hypothetical protein